MAVPDFQTLMRPVLLAASEGVHSTTEYINRVAEMMSLSDEDLAEKLPSGTQTRLANRIYWGLIHLQRAGLLARQARGQYGITDAGWQALQANPHKIDLPTLKAYPAYQNWLQSFSDKTSNADKEGADAAEASLGGQETPQENIESLFSKIDKDLRGDLIDRVTSASWQFFEQLVVDVLVAMGYGGGKAEMAKALKSVSDHGVDGIIKQDPLGLDIVYVQAKRYQFSNSVGRPEVQSFSGALDHFGSHKGVFITTSTFTSGAADYAAKINKRIILIDGHQLAGHMVENGVGIRVKAKYALRDIDEDYFIE